MCKPALNRFNRSSCTGTEISRLPLIEQTCINARLRDCKTLRFSKHYAQVCATTSTFSPKFLHSPHKICERRVVCPGRAHAASLAGPGQPTESMGGPLGEQAFITSLPNTTLSLSFFSFFPPQFVFIRLVNKALVIQSLLKPHTPAPCRLL